MTAEFILQELLAVANEEKALQLMRFFKTGKGQYGEGDRFLGVTVPVVRDIVKGNKGMAPDEIQILLDSPYHEARLAGLLCVMAWFKAGKRENDRKVVFEFYLKNARQANNWDLVDISCRDIVGAYLLDKNDRSVLYRLAESDNLWEQRMAIVSTWFFIKHKQYADTLQLSVKLMGHPHDLMHKAIGWMLREVGKKDEKTLLGFLEVYHRQMPRTALRYSIERFNREERAYFMKKE